MARVSYSIKGLDKLEQGLLKRAQVEAIKTIVKKHTTELQQKAMANASSTYVKGYSTGATKKSIGIGFEDGGLTGITGLGLSYDPYLETGTRFMAAEPLLKPLFNQRKNMFISEIKKVVE
ncbi:phage head-tail joining protein [Ligilactobacillus pabuli]|uniref:Phage head-tail joining protein n=1 Tax=Ligilactobacillus pabuli TaxID=2886039 RepID=A0ABQ5JHW7_9LACO|nr:HK97 gp10 family phage protein [Ligilactobacillus pabuli]GKS80729.1 phage head-tail joining protein [Ligilactobacillus pabuli]